MESGLSVEKKKSLICMRASEIARTCQRGEYRALTLLQIVT
jgi:hypothetical protein